MLFLHPQVIISLLKAEKKGFNIIIYLLMQVSSRKQLTHTGSTGKGLCTRKEIRITRYPFYEQELKLSKVADTVQTTYSPF